MLTHSCSVRSVRGEDLVAAVHIVLLYQILLCFIQVFSVRDYLLEWIRSETSQEVLFKLRIRPWGRSIMMMFEL